MKSSITINEAGTRIRSFGLKGYSRSAIHQKIKSGDLKTVGKKGRNIMIDKASLEDHIRRETGVFSDWMIAVYVRTSSTNDPFDGNRRKQLSITKKWVSEICKERNIPIIRNPGNYRASNLKIYLDKGSVNDDKGQPLSKMEQMFKHMALGCGGKGPKVKYLMVNSIDRLTRGDIGIVRAYCKALDVELICRDMIGLTEPEVKILGLRGIAYAKEAREAIARRQRYGIRMSKVEKALELQPLVYEALRFIGEGVKKSKVNKLKGLLIAIGKGDRSRAMYSSLKEVLDS